MDKYAVAAALVDMVQVSKSYGREKLALDQVSLSVQPGAFTVLLGPSGSGKTTLLRTLAGIERIDQGEITISGQQVASSSGHVQPEKRGLAMVFQDYALWPHLQVWQNVAFALKRHRHSASERERQAKDILGRMGLQKLAKRYPAELSGGEQQRVSLARALVGNCGLVLFDEPLSNLDADLRERMRLEISTLTRESGATSIYITHDQSEAFAMADSIAVMKEGRLIQNSDPESLYRSPRSAFVARFTGVAGELLGEVLTVDSKGIATVRLSEGGCVTVSGRLLEPFSTPSRSALILVRPSAVKIHSVGSALTQARAVVTDVAYRGRGYEIAVELECGGQMHSIFSPHRIARRSAVGVSFEEEGTLLFPADLPLRGPQMALEEESEEREVVAI